MKTWVWTATALYEIEHIVEGLRFRKLCNCAEIFHRAKLYHKSCIHSHLATREATFYEGAILWSAKAKMGEWEERQAPASLADRII